MDKSTWLVTDEDKLYFITEAHIITDTSEIDEDVKELVLSLSKSKDDADLLWFSGTYCTANIRNRNGDGFKFDTLVGAANTPKLKPVNWLHREDEKVGVIVDSKFIKGKKEKSGNIQIIGVIWQGTETDRQYAEQVEENYKRGTMGLSMECLGTEVECSVCGNVFPIQTATKNDPFKHYCSHLKNRRVDGKAVRWICDPLFVGVGLIPAIMKHQPADDTAWVKEVASLHDNEVGKEVNNMADTYSQEQVDRLLAEKGKVHKAEIDKINTAHKDEVKDIKAEHAKAVEEKDTKIEELNTTVGEQSQVADELTEATTKLETLKTDKKAVDAELKTYKDEQKAKEEAKLNERVAELKKNPDVTDEMIESLRAQIVDDDKFAELQKALSKVKETDDGKPKTRFESKRSNPQDAATVVRNIMQKARENSSQ